jgi:hypothetical protein
MGETQFLEPDLVAEAFHAKRGDQMDSRSKCQLTAFPAGAVQYTPTSGYVGGDNATVLINDHGYEGVEHFVFRVLPKPADAAPVSR